MESYFLKIVKKRRVAESCGKIKLDFWENSFIRFYYYCLFMSFENAEKTKNISFTKEEREALEMAFLRYYNDGKGRSKDESLLNSAEELGGDVLEKMRKKTPEAKRKLAEDILKKYKSSATFHKMQVEGKDKRILEDLDLKTKIVEKAKNLAEIDLTSLMPKLQDKLKEVEFVKIDMRSNAGAYRLLHYGLEEVANLARETPDDKIKLGALTLLVETASKKINAVDPLEILQEVEEKSKQFTKDNT
jgi:hypothetical protein